MAIRGHRYFGIVHFRPTHAKQERINSLSGSINLDPREQIFITEATSSCSAYYWSETELTGSALSFSPKKSKVAIGISVIFELLW